MSQLKKPKCITCKHSTKSNSCGPCSTKNTKLLDNISNTLGVEIPESEKINELKHSCKILLKYPEDFDTINPYKCKYYMPSYLRMY